MVPWRPTPDPRAFLWDDVTDGEILDAITHEQQLHLVDVVEAVSVDGSSRDATVVTLRVAIPDDVLADVVANLREARMDAAAEDAAGV